MRERERERERESQGTPCCLYDLMMMMMNAVLISRSGFVIPVECCFRHIFQCDQKINRFYYTKKSKSKIGTVNIFIFLVFLVHCYICQKWIVFVVQRRAKKNKKFGTTTFFNCFSSLLHISKSGLLFLYKKEQIKIRNGHIF